MIQQPATAPPNLPDTANIGHDAPLAIQHAPQQLPAEVQAPANLPNRTIVCEYYLQGECFYGNECRNSHDPTNGHLNNENVGKRRRTRGGQRYNKNKASDGG